MRNKSAAGSAGILGIARITCGLVWKARENDEGWNDQNWQCPRLRFGGLENHCGNGMPGRAVAVRQCDFAAKKAGGAAWAGSVGLP